ncbi:MAG: choice-of-anchor B family protein, partial [Saprospiraceae bacterium]
MRNVLLYSLLFAATSLFAQTNVAFRSKLTYPGQELANIWGYEAGGREYALVGAYNGLSIVDVTNADSPVEIVQIPGAHSDWHEIKTYSHYAYVVSEGGMGVQIIDLTNLPGSNLAYHSYYGDGAINGLLPKAHALHIDVTKGYLYVYGCQTLFSGKPLVFNLNVDPYNPTYVNYVNFVGYAHDGYVDNDILYTAHIYAGLFAIVNMANKSNPVLLATQITPNAFTHNTWPSGSTVFTTDEKTNSFLAAYDVSTPGNITLLDKIQATPGSGSIIHNTHILNDYAITSWYRDGVAITDVSRPANLVQVGNYDTYPNGAGNGFDGAWGVYPFLSSGNLIVSNIAASGTGNGELWVLTPTYVRGCYLEGSVRNASNGLPVNAATVQVLTTTTSGTSTANGQYKIGQLQSGNFTAQVSKTGYYTQNIAITLTNGVLTPLDVFLV